MATVQHCHNLATPKLSESHLIVLFVLTQWFTIVCYDTPVYNYTVMYVPWWCKTITMVTVKYYHSYLTKFKLCHGSTMVYHSMLWYTSLSPWCTICCTIVTMVATILQ